MQWQGSVPISKEFNDVYYSEGDGLAESRYVFIDGNSLPDRLRTHESHEFTIIETGFGTGLNFFALYNLWLSLDKKPNKLNYISIEKYPLSTSDIKKSLANWPEISHLTTDFIKQYSSSNESCKISLENEQIDITLLYCDISDAWSKITKAADAWFLDGFSPSKNPDMWQDSLYKNMQKISNINASVATFTSAGFVRRGLENHGFKVTKAKGFGKKRTMLVGKV